MGEVTRPQASGEETALVSAFASPCAEMGVCSMGPLQNVDGGACLMDVATQSMPGEDECPPLQSSLRVALLSQVFPNRGPEHTSQRQRYK